MDLSDLPGELVERGVWWQIAWFAIVSAVSVAALVEFEGSESRAYRYCEAAVKTMYWANVFVLIGLFEGVRRMFEKASELRARYREQAERRAVERGIEQGLEQGIKERDARWREAVERFGTDVDGVKVLSITPEVQGFLDKTED